jgi:transcriptional regulator with XRE-family HTH domain
LDTGADLKSAREQLSMVQTDLCNVLGIGISTLKRHESSQALNPLIALAVECLLRREQSKRTAPVSPEERAERKFREREHLRKLRIAAGEPVDRTPAGIAARQVAIAAERRRLKEEAGLLASPAAKAVAAVAYKSERRRVGLAHARNLERDRERPLIAELQSQLRPLGAAAVETGDWTPYVRAVDLACMGLGLDPAPYRSAYLEEARNRLVADDDPLVTLPLEPEE